MWSRVDVVLPPTREGCFNESVPQMNVNGKDMIHFTTGTAAECAAFCCGNSSTCCGYTWAFAQPTGSGLCSTGGHCCWMKTGTCELAKGNCGPPPGGNCTSALNGAYKPIPTPPPSPTPPPTPSKFYTPVLSFVSMIATDASGNLRDPSAMIQDPATKKWHFWVDYMSGGTQAGWHAYQHHYSADAIAGPWKLEGLAFNHSTTDPEAWDYAGQFSPSVIYDAAEPGDAKWFYFYSASGANQSKLLTCAQMVRSSTSPSGPWSEPLGVVARPTGTPPAWSGAWNTRRLDSGRALIIGGKRGYWTKGVSGTNVACEGLYLPKDSSSSFAPPYAEWQHNPLYSPARFGKYDAAGYENCEFFMASKEHGGLLHVVCSWHSGRGPPPLPHGGSPHFVIDLANDPTGRNWTYAGSLSWQAPDSKFTPGEPTPVYEGGAPGDEASVNYFIARTATGKTGAGGLAIGLFKLSWIAPQ